MTIKVENNFLHNTTFWKMCKTISSENFPWYVDGVHDDFIHNLIYDPNLKKENSFYATKILNPLIEKLNVKNIISSKITLNNSSSKKEKKAPYEEDVEENNQTFKGLLCMNTNNSEIEILGKNKISLVENRFISFPKNIPYFGSTHTDVRFRILLELVYNV